uniref:Uncharacterized protein n=1 Tax=Rhizophora mucronata TaxID=61149 RepID=A0A2P2NUE0_RHIMU
MWMCICYYIYANLSFDIVALFWTICDIPFNKVTASVS